MPEIRQEELKAWCSTQNTGKSQAVRPCIVHVKNQGKSLQKLLLTAQGSAVKVCQLENGKMLRQLNGGHIDSKVVSVSAVAQTGGSSFSELAISCAKNGSLVCWNVVTGKPIFGGKIEGASSLVKVYVLSEEELLIVTRKAIYRSRVENLFQRIGRVSFPLVQLTNCDINDERQVSFEAATGSLAFIFDAKRSQIGILPNIADPTALQIHQFGHFRAERLERTRWYARDSLRQDLRAFLECISLARRELDDMTILTIGGFSGRVYHYILDQQNGEIRAPQIDHYHGYGLHDLAWCDDGHSLVTVGREQVVVKTKVTFGEMEIGETEGSGKKRNRTFIPHLHLGSDRVVCCDDLLVTVALHQDGLVSVFGNDVKVSMASFCDPLAIQSSRLMYPLSKKGMKKSKKFNTEKQFDVSKVPMAKFGEDMLVMPSARPGVIQFLRPKENRLEYTLDVSQENFTVRDKGSSCTRIVDIATHNQDTLAVVESRSSSLQNHNFYYCTIKIYNTSTTADNALKFSLAKSIDYTGEHMLTKIAFSAQGEKLLIAAEKEEVFVYEVNDEGKWEFLQAVRLNRCRIRDAVMSHDGSLLAVATKFGVKLFALDGESFDSTPVLKTIEVDARKVEFFTKRFKRHQILIQQFSPADTEPPLLVYDTISGELVVKSSDVPNSTEPFVYDRHSQTIAYVSGGQIHQLDLALAVISVVQTLDRQYLAHAVMYDRVVALTRNGLFISVTEPDSPNATPETDAALARLGGCELVENSYFSSGTAASYGSKPKTAMLFSERDLTVSQEQLCLNTQRKLPKQIGDLKNRRPLAVLTESTLHDIPVNFSLQNMNLEHYCFEFL